MEVKGLFCGVILAVLGVPGIYAQLDVCGSPSLNTRIVGGEDADEGAWPWQASLHSSGRHFCGGTLITAEWVMTAAHCFSSDDPSDLIIYLGRHTQQNLNSNEESRLASKIIIHSDYDEDTQNNDIALVQLASAVTFTDYISPACLPATGSIFDAGTTCWTTGWGFIRDGVPLGPPQTLQEVSVPVVSNSVCRNAFEQLTANMICAGLDEGGKDSCQGDSGGPLVTKGSSKWVQCGVVSFGRGCAKPNAPGVYTRVSKYQDWINSMIVAPLPGYITFGSSSGTIQVFSYSSLLLLSILPVLFSTFIFSLINYN